MFNSLESEALVNLCRCGSSAAVSQPRPGKRCHLQTRGSHRTASCLTCKLHDPVNPLTRYSMAPWHRRLMRSTVRYVCVSGRTRGGLRACIWCTAAFRHPRCGVLFWCARTGRVHANELHARVVQLRCTEPTGCVRGGCVKVRPHAVNLPESERVAAVV